MKIHREGYPILAFSGAFLVVVNLLLLFWLPHGGWQGFQLPAGLLSLLFFGLILQFFRVPRRPLALRKDHVLSPADGKIVAIEEVYEPEYFRDQRLKVSIFLSVFDVHVNLNPVSGKVRYFKYHPGKYLVAFHPKSSERNERTTLVIRADNGQEILLRQIAGFLARRIVWYVARGMWVTQGQEFGFIKFGSRVDVLLPLGTEVLVALGDRTVGGKTRLARLEGQD